MLDSPGLTKLVAHELGHYVLGHDSIIPQAVSQAEWERAQQQRELDANAKAVEILVRAQGLSETAALQMVVDALRRAQDAQTRGAPLTPGHLPASAELADLLARFPAAAALPR
jgi:IrrE N-terminal-like domain